MSKDLDVPIYYITEEFDEELNKRFGKNLLYIPNSLELTPNELFWWAVLCDVDIFRLTTCISSLLRSWRNVDTIKDIFKEEEKQLLDFYHGTESFTPKIKQLYLTLDTQLKQLFPDGEHKPSLNYIKDDDIRAIAYITEEAEQLLSSNDWENKMKAISAIEKLYNKWRERIEEAKVLRKLWEWEVINKDIYISGDYITEPFFPDFGNLPLDRLNNLLTLEDIWLNKCKPMLVAKNFWDDNFITGIRGGIEEQEKQTTSEQQASTNTSLEPQLKLKELLPDTLQGVEVIGIFSKAIDIKLITIEQDGLKWNDTKQLCAYFAEKLSNKFHLSKITDKDGNQTTAWKPFEDLFKEKGLKGAKQNWMRLNTKFEPIGYNKIDTLFTDCK